jgi:purine-nucleoside phosphorylase
VDGSASVSVVSFTSPQVSWQRKAEEAGDILVKDWGRQDICVVLGSGWSSAVESWESEGSELRPVTGLPGFSAQAVAGHAGSVQSVSFEEYRALVFRGRTHYYESRDPFAVAHAVRVALATGCRLIVLTNAAGAINTEYTLGQPVLIRDHLNLTWASPFNEPPDCDMTAIYAPRLIEKMQQLVPGIRAGVYAQFLGPQYESPAEIRMAALAGADLAGMSTAIEALAAVAGGAEVMGVSLVTNAAAGTSEAALDHADVLAVGRRSAGAVLGKIRAAIPRLLTT